MNTAAMGSFEGWAELVPQAVVWLDLPDPLDTRKDLAIGSDNEEQVLRRFINALSEYDGAGKGVVLGELIEQLYRPMRPLEAVGIELKAAVEDVTDCSPGEVPTARQLGARLKGLRRRVVGGCLLDADPAEETRGGLRWRVRLAQGNQAT